MQRATTEVSFLLRSKIIRNLYFTTRWQGHRKCAAVAGQHTLQQLKAKDVQRQEMPLEEEASRHRVFFLGGPIF